jgi:uncharacterized protein
MILLDTSGLLSAIDSAQKAHSACVAVLKKTKPPLLLSPFVLAELDYLLLTRMGVDAELALLEQVGGGAYQIEHFSAADTEAAREVVERYREHSIGLADASLVVLSERHEIRDVLTLDERHFRVLRAYGGKPFRILPGSK